MRILARTKSIEQSKIRDYIELCKPRIAMMVVLTVYVGGLLSGIGAEIWTLTAAAIGVLLVAASGCAMNQYLERYTDFMMPRTANRPLPGGRLSANETVIFGTITLALGLTMMFALCHWSVGTLGLVTWFLYVWVYTPLKGKTIYNTMVGAVPGAMPILIGAAAMENGINAATWWFFAVLCVWQFPHFMSIAWLYRKDYADGNLKMVTVTDPSGYWAGIWAIGFASALIPVSFMPAIFVENLVGRVLVVLAGIILGVWFLKASIRFATTVRVDRGVTADVAARKLLRVSLMYLPLYMFALVVAVLLS